MHAVLSSLGVTLMVLCNVTSGMEVGFTPCMSNCTGKPDGDYQSCAGCGGYVTCLGGMLNERKCVAGTVWDDSFKRCEDKSSTCTSSPPKPCVSSCQGVSNGDHQSCNVPCPSGLVFNNDFKHCAVTSPTRPQVYLGTESVLNGSIALQFEIKK